MSMPSSNPNTASMEEVQQLIRRLKRLEDNWPSEPTLADLSPRLLNGLLAYNSRVRRGVPMLRVLFGLVCGACLSILMLCAQKPANPAWIVALLPLMLLWIYRYDPSREYRSPVNALTQSNDLRVSGNADLGDAQ